VTEQPSRSWWQRPRWPAALIAIVIFALGQSRDIGVYIEAILLAPALLILLGIGATSMYSTYKIPSRRRECYWAMAIMLATSLGTYFYVQFRDPVRFLVWAPFHRDLLKQAPDQDGIITWWDGWGLAGMENDSYLVRAGNDRLTTYDEANVWAQRLGLSCKIVWGERVWPKLYVVTTYNCGFEPHQIMEQVP
jgi:hypothetical protein